MKPQSKITGQLATDILNRFPNTPTLTLARMLYNENKEVFNSIDHARAALRYRRGAIGVRNRKKIASKEQFRDFSADSWNPFKLPETEEAEYLPYFLSNDVRKILLLCDVHIPYHNIEALTAALKKGKEDQVDTIVIDGDFIDFYQLSRFDKDPRRRGFAYEINSTREVLSIIRREFPNARIYYKMGNHEERYEKYLKVKAPELLDCEDYKLEILLRFGEYRIECIDDKRIIYAGKLRILHGHEFTTSAFSPVNPARGYYMRAKKSMIAGHNHQTSEHTEPDLDDEMTTVWSVGCLCELHPAYMPINKWNHGFARIDLDEDGNFKVNNYRIKNGQIL